MRILSRIALSNFIFPSLFSIAQLIVVYRNVNALIVNEIVLVNSMVAVFGVVFATVWAGKVIRRDAELDGWDDASDSDEEKRPTRRAFAFPGLGSWRIASAPQTVTFESAGYAVPSLPMENGGFDGIGVENRNNPGMSELDWGFGAVSFSVRFLFPRGGGHRRYRSGWYDGDDRFYGCKDWRGERGYLSRAWALDTGLSSIFYVLHWVPWIRFHFIHYVTQAVADGGVGETYLKRWLIATRTVGQASSRSFSHFI